MTPDVPYSLLVRQGQLVILMKSGLYFIGVINNYSCGRTRRDRPVPMRSWSAVALRGGLAPPSPRRNGSAPRRDVVALNKTQELSKLLKKLCHNIYVSVDSLQHRIPNFRQHCCMHVLLTFWIFTILVINVTILEWWNIKVFNRVLPQTL